MFRVELRTFWPPIETCKFVNDSGDSVAGQVSNGDFHWKSVSPLVDVAAMNGQINTTVGCTIPELTKALKEDPTARLVQLLVTKLR